MRAWTVAVALGLAACADAGPRAPDAGSDGAPADSGPDAACPGSLELTPVTFHAYNGDFTCQTVADPSLGVSLRIWLYNDGAPVLDTTVKCADPTRLADLLPGDYELAAGLPPILTFGTGLALAGEEYAPGCTPGATGPVCAPVRVTVLPCTTGTIPLDLYCTDVIADGCHGF
jgi:hypothetical protein